MQSGGDENVPLAMSVSVTNHMMMNALSNARCVFAGRKLIERSPIASAYYKPFTATVFTSAYEATPIIMLPCTQGKSIMSIITSSSAAFVVRLLHAENGHSDRRL